MLLKVSDFGNVEVKTFGGEKGVLIRTELQQLPADVYPKILSSIDKVFQVNFPTVTKTIVDSAYNSITYKLSDVTQISNIIDKLIENKFQTMVFSHEEGNDQIIVRIGISDWIEEALIEKHAENPFTVLKEDRVGPKIGEELKRDAIIAVFLALLVILTYLWLRFKLTFAVGAVVALFHDVLITLGMFFITLWFNSRTKP